MYVVWTFFLGYFTHCTVFNSVGKRKSWFSIFELNLFIWAWWKSKATWWLPSTENITIDALEDEDAFFHLQMKWMPCWASAAWTKNMKPPYRSDAWLICDLFLDRFVTRPWNMRMLNYDVARSCVDQYIWLCMRRRSRLSSCNCGMAWRVIEGRGLW
jgi:hypothetical protein